MKKKYPPKSVLFRVLAGIITNVGLKPFFSHFSQEVLLECCKDIDDLSEYEDEDLAEFSKKELIKAIINNVYSFGFTHLFSSFQVSDLKKFCKKLGLKVESSSKETIIDSLLEQKSYKKPKITKKEEKPHTKKPKAIKEGISKVDLQYWYNKEELEEWLRTKEAKVTGKKSELVARIMLYLSGDIERTMPNWKREKKKE